MASIPSLVMIGGQAVVEGVLMRSDERWALSVRRPDGGIARTGGPTPVLPLARLPLVRGLAAIVVALRLGMFAIRWSVGVATGVPDAVDRRSFRRSALIAVVIVLSVFVGFPALAGRHSVDGSAQIWVETLVRTAVVIAYLVAVGMLPPIRRVFQYHGAEHQAVATYEARLPLTVEAARGQSMLHPRCGTTFIVVVALLSGAVHPLLEHAGLDLVTARIVGIPVTIAVAYELMRAASSNLIVMAPVRALLVRVQFLTTREPDDAQLEVALDALRAVSEDTARNSGTESLLRAG